MPDVTIEQSAGFAAHAAPDDDEDALAVRGIALGEGLAQGSTSDSGDGPSYYPPEVLDAAADNLVGKKIVDDSNHDDLESKHPPNGAIVGEVTDAQHEPGVGIAFEGEVHREPERSLIEAGLVDVSPALFHGGAEYDEDLGGRAVEDIAWWRDLAVVDSGGSPAATIEALQSDAGAGMVAEALADTFDAADGVDDEDATRAPADGDTNPDGEESGTETMADDDNPEDPDETTVEGLRKENERLRAELTELREADAEELEAENENLRDQLEELDDELEDLREQMEPVESQAVEAMSQRTDLPEDVVREKFDTGEMFDTLTEGDESPDSVAEALSLTPDPQSGDPDPTSGKGGSIGDLSSDDEAEIESLAERAETFDGVDDEYAETLRSEAADIAGVDDFEDLTVEVV